PSLSRKFLHRNLYLHHHHHHHRSHPPSLLRSVFTGVATTTVTLIITTAQLSVSHFLFLVLSTLRKKHEALTSGSSFTKSKSIASGYQVLAYCFTHLCVAPKLDAFGVCVETSSCGTVVNFLSVGDLTRRSFMESLILEEDRG
ncbi:hypothetical protein HID58_045924, partial [Brassica napus]